MEGYTRIETEPIGGAAIDNRLKYEEKKQKTRLQTKRVFCDPPNLADGLLLVFDGCLGGSEASDRNAER